MQRREVLKGIGASSVAALGVSGLASARRGSSDLYVVTEIGGESRRLTLDEFDQHPETRSLSDVSLESDCAYECCECCEICCPNDLCMCSYNCGYCDQDC